MVVATSLNAKATACNPFLIDEKPALSHRNRGYLAHPIVLVLVVVLVLDFPLWGGVSATVPLETVVGDRPWLGTGQMFAILQL